VRVIRFSPQYFAIQHKYNQKSIKMKLAQLKKYRNTIQKRLDNSRTFLEMLNSEFSENRDLLIDNDLTDLVFETEMVNLIYFNNNDISFKKSFDLMIIEAQNLIDSLERLIESLNFTIQYSELENYKK
jgi:hypothetical protein